MKASEVLKNARRMYGRRDLCASNVIFYATIDGLGVAIGDFHPEEMSLRKAAQTYLAEAAGIDTSVLPENIWTWHDALVRSEGRGPVFDAFDHAIKLALEDEAEADHA